jgi:hypothetical protein
LKRKHVLFYFEKIREKETKDGILDYAIPVKVNEREKKTGARRFCYAKFHPYLPSSQLFFIFSFFVFESLYFKHHFFQFIDVPAALATHYFGGFHFLQCSNDAFIFV